jgi:endo-1,4-beta-xylanase
VNRRNFVASLSCLPIALPRSFGQEIQPVPRLRDIAKTKNLLIGSAVAYRELQQPSFTTLLADQASIVVCENEMKWQIIHPEPDRYDFTRADALLSFATQHAQKLRGHNLCWHNQLPSWFAHVASAHNAADLLKQHIATVAGHYAGHIHSWDVVNEAIHVEDGRPDGLRKSPWLELVGPEYIEIAYRAAAAADPNALLTYNDYDIEQDGPGFDAKRAAVLGLLKSLRQKNVPIQAIGLQSHLRARLKKPDWTALHKFIDAVEQMGLVVFVTELDVNDSDLPSDIAERDRLVGDWYYGYLSNVLQHASLKAILTWGLTDRDSWLNGLRRRSGQQMLLRPLPFDADLKPKPAFYAMQRAISEARPRT